MVEGVESKSARRVDDLFVLRSGVRSGLKREFAFALKVQAELSSNPVGRTRSGKVRSSSPFADGVGICKEVKRSGGGKKRRVGISKEEEVLSVRLDSVEAIDVKEPSALEEEVGHVEDGEEGYSLGNMKVDNEIVELEEDKESSLGTVKREPCGDGLDRDIPDVEVGESIVRDKLKGLTMTKPLSSEALACVDRHEDPAEVVSSGIPLYQSDEQKSSSSMEVESSGIHSSQHEEQKIDHTLEMTPSVISDNRENTIPSTTEIECNVTPKNQQSRPFCTLKMSSPVIPEDQIDDEIPNGVPEILSMNILNNQLTEQKPVLVSELSNLNILKFHSGEHIPVSSLEVLNGAASAGQDAKESLYSVPEKPFSATAITMESIKPEKPLRRFTRSLLKSVKDESSRPMEPPSMATSSSNSDSSDVKVEINLDDGASKKLVTTPKSKMELKMSKKIILTKLPGNVRDLLATGLLDGLTVKYIASSKQKVAALYGIIKDGGILCSCSSCKGTNVVSAYKFEVHSGSTKKHPSDYIVLENGKSIRDVLRACANTPLNMLEFAIQNAIGSTSNSSTFREFDELYQSSHSGKLSPMFDSCPVKRLTSIQKTPYSFPKKNIRLTKSSLGPDSSDNALKNDSSQKKNGYGRVTTKDTWLHKLVFMDDTLPEGTEVGYYARGQRLLEGYIKAGGILCSCCNTVVSPSQFEAHAGWAKRRKPYLNIYTSNGVSLHELSVSLSKGRKFTARENDDLCRMCADGGDLILCDLCPRAFHKECVGLSEPPNGDWYCPCCESMHQRESYVAHNENAIAAGRVSGVDPIEQIFERCIRIVQSPDNDASSCVLCRCHDFSRSGFGPRTVLLCDQCEKEFHIGCLKEHKIADLRELPEGKWFCCSGCSETHAALQKALLCGSQPLSNLLLENIKRKRMEKGIINEIEIDLRWTLLNGKGASPDSRLLLSKVISIFHESFDPIIDIFTGQDLIPAMVYGRELGEQDFGGMFCALLTVNSNVVSAGILRILGRDIAELPLVATTKDFQGLGYFQALFSCIETLLESLEVKNLVLPATKEAEAIWIKRFGFREISLKQLAEYTKGSRPMNFQGTPMLHKAVPGSLEVDEKVS